jgi:hypothetical protein
MKRMNFGCMEYPHARATSSEPELKCLCVMDFIGDAYAFVSVAMMIMQESLKRNMWNGDHIWIGTRRWSPRMIVSVVYACL